MARWICPKCKKSFPEWINKEHIKDCEGKDAPQPKCLGRLEKALNTIESK